jgi:hypothetical protein
MKKIIFVALGLFAIKSAFSIELKKIADLNSSEPYSPQVFHDGFLWVGRLDFSTGKNRYFLEVRSQSGEKVLASKDTPHSIINLYPFDDRHVLFTGKLFIREGWRTYYSLAEYDYRGIHLDTHILPEQFQVEQFTGGPGKLFFDMVSDRTLVQLDSKGANPMPLFISGPGSMAQIGDSIFVLERRSWFLGDEDVARVDLKTLKVDRVFSEYRKGILNILPIENGKTLVATEAFAQQILLIDTKTHSLRTSVPMPNSYPESVAEIGHCVVVGCYSPTHLSLVDLSFSTPKVVDEFFFEQHQHELPNIAKMSFDPKTGDLFLRSNGIGFDDAEDTNSIYRFSNPNWIKRCQSPNKLER